jgi:hypothetical protein
MNVALMSRLRREVGLGIAGAVKAANHYMELNCTVCLLRA